MSVRLASIASFVFVSSTCAWLAGCGEPELESPEVPARQHVVFEVKNESGAAAVVATQGKGCGAWTVERLEGTSWSTVRLPTVSSDAGEACCAPGAKCVTTKRAELPSVHSTRISQGEAMWIEWDARERIAPEGECIMRGRRLEAVEPVPAGRYRVTFGVHGRDACGDDAPGCTLPTQASPAKADLCDASKTVQVEFEIPTAGDVVVPVAVR